MSPRRVLTHISATIDLSIHVPASVLNIAVLCSSIWYGWPGLITSPSLRCALLVQEYGTSFHLLTDVCVGLVLDGRVWSEVLVRDGVWPPVLVTVAVTENVPGFCSA